MKKYLFGILCLLLLDVAAAEDGTSIALERIGAASQAAEGLLSRLQKLQAGGLDCSYPKVSITVVRHLAPFLRQDVLQGQMTWVERSLTEMNALLEKAEAELKALEERRRRPADIPRYVTSDVSIRGRSFIADTKTFSGDREHNPVFFTGYGHFIQVRKDIEVFPALGINVIQIEFGPNSVLPSENEVSNVPVEEFLKVADRAAASHVAIDLLLSPHYFPQWAKNKYPELNQCSGGFLQFCIDAPAAREILETSLRHVISQVGHHPALLSVCLSNEPVSIESRNCSYTQHKWHQWLELRHNTLQTLNQRHQQEYASFDEVPIPAPGLQVTPLYYDWCIFNMERLAGWHCWMADIIHDIAPDLPVHAKIMVFFALNNRGLMHYGVDPQLFAELGQINGNDSYKFYGPTEVYANHWLQQNIDYDFQSSVGGKPIFNSENHLIADRGFRDIPPAHIRNVLWQQAIHGQGATTLWVWERTSDPHHDFAGSILHRPACIDAVGRTNLDLFQYRDAVTAIKDKPPEVYILHSYASLLYDEHFAPMLNKLYEALSFTGTRIGFITERQLAAEALSPGKLLFAPQTSHLTEAAYGGLRTFQEKGGKIASVAAGERPLFRFNEYGQEQPEELALERLIDGTLGDPEFLTQVIDVMEALNPPGPIQVVSGASGEVLKGVEYLYEKQPDGHSYWLNVVSYRNTPEVVHILFNGRQVGFKDLLEETEGELLKLEPLVPHLLVVLAPNSRL